MTLEPEIAVVLSVMMHVTWNLIARYQSSRAFPLWWVLLAHLIMVAPWGFWALITEVHWNLTFALLLLISASANVIYFLGLRQAYHHAPVPLVYPLVRSSPLLIAIWSVLLFGETLGIWAWAGIIVSVAGLLILAFSSGSANDKRALPWAMTAMLATSVYSLSDKAAVSSLNSFSAIVGFISVGYFCSWLALSVLLVRQTGDWRPRTGISPLAMFTGGLCIGLAYALVVFAMKQMPSAVVVAYSNAGIIVASVISILFLRERWAWKQRVLAAMIILIGIIMIYRG
ncbi:phosphonate utilization associated putative membrane protein [Amphritea atlantica]|uniref:Phosphonate utilization associated putative membrane protein n=1 Tax=Amphritea atlantica TaxID=355243 RepID=A0A1H9DCV8_9GAMM|nr:EamA family transporter [Amphritea atlantica]SEQ11209.1 phosphonate utilization associated putative membrane protein [Amphritea atlantica]